MINKIQCYQYSGFCFLRIKLSLMKQLLNYRILVPQRADCQQLIFGKARKKKVKKNLRDVDALICSTNYR